MKKTSSPLRQVASVHDLLLQAEPRRQAAHRRLVAVQERPAVLGDQPAGEEVPERPAAPAGPRRGWPRTRSTGPALPGLCVHSMCAQRRPARPAPTIAIRGFADARDEASRHGGRGAPASAAPQRRPRRRRSAAHAWSARPRRARARSRLGPRARAPRVTLQPACRCARSARAGRTCAAPRSVRASALLALVKPPFSSMSTG